MAPRAIWKGAISFGMVVIPVKLYAGTENHDIRFVQLHSTCHNRIRQKRFCPYHETDVEMDEIIRGYEYAKDLYVVMDDSDFDDLPVPSKHTIEISQFAELREIDPIFFERTYLLEPEDIGRKPYTMLKQVMEQTGRVAVGALSIRQKEHLCCLRPYEGGLAVATMFRVDELRSTGELSWEESSTVGSEEIQMATALVDQLTRKFDPSKYEDAYRAQLEQVIEAKLGKAEPVAAAPMPQKSQMGDLMAALRASIEATKDELPVETNGHASNGRGKKKQKVG